MKVQNILLIVLAVLILGVFYFRKTETDVIVDDNKEQIDSLKKLLVQEELYRLKLQTEITTLKDSVDYFDKQATANNIKYQNLRRNYNEKIDSIRHLTSNGVQQYFSNRYK